MKVTLKEGFEYIPTWNDNDKQPNDGKIKVHMKFLSGADVSECYGADGKVDMKKEWLIICESVDNLEINGVEVGPEGIMSQPGLMPLYLELKAAYQTETVIDKKKL